MKKGVPGMIGNTAPIAPKIKLKMVAATQKKREIANVI
jgi:hypothetical protein